MGRHGSRGRRGPRRRGPLRGPRSGPRSKGRRGGSKRAGTSSRIKPLPSSLPVPVASSSTLRLPRNRSERPVYRSYLFALGAVLLLVLLGGGGNALAHGGALLVSGAILILAPPRVNPGRWVNLGVLGVLGALCLAFLPPFYWPLPEWRVRAVELGIELPGMLSVRPRVSFEALLLTCAGFAWFYALLSLPLNAEGRRRILLILSGVVALLAALVAAGNVLDWRYPGAPGYPGFSFFADRGRMACVLAIGGVIGFAYAMEGLKRREGEHLVGLLAAILALLALMQGFPSGAILLFFGGMLAWFALRLFYTSTVPYLKIGLPVALLLYSFVVFGGGPTLDRFRETVFSPSSWGADTRFAVYGDALAMLRDNPVGGMGAGMFGTVFPHYRDASLAAPVAHPQSDVVWLAAESGLPALVFLGLFLFGLLRRFFPLPTGRNAHYQLVALAGLGLFLLQGLASVTGHHPATAYLALLVMALALPSRLQRKAGGFLPKRFWRLGGAVLAAFGLFWMAGAAFNLPLYSAIALERLTERADRAVAEEDYPEAASALDEALGQSPLDWNLHFRRARLDLGWKGDKEAAAAGFTRARFAAPVPPWVPFQEGVAWVPYDLERTVSAWREALARASVDGSGESLFRAMLRRARGNYGLWQRVKPLSMLDPGYRVLLLSGLKGREFVNELETELARDPALRHFDPESRMRLVESWITGGDIDTAAAFLEEHGASLPLEWYLTSLLRYQQARFEEGVEIFRASVPPPALPASELDEPAFNRLARVFAADPGAFERGTLLFRAYLERGDVERAMAVLEAMAAVPGTPDHVHYWRGEILYRQRDFIDSWNAFNSYVQLALR